MKIVVLDRIPLDCDDLNWKELKELGEVTIYSSTKKEEVVERIGDAPIVLTNHTRLGEDHFKACPKLRYVGVLATGYNMVDVEAAKKYGVVVTNIPSYGSKAVAQHAFALLLSAIHQPAYYHRCVQEGAWQDNKTWCGFVQPTIELDGRTMGIVGYGRIGAEVAKMAQAFGMKVVAYNRSGKAGEGVQSVTMEELYRQSDVISLHCPLTDETRHMINEKSFSQMKEGVILINTSRGPLIDEEALVVALRCGKVAYALLDVTEVEPTPLDNPLLKEPHCMITPHMAWIAQETRARLLDVAIDNVRAYMDGREQNRVV